MSTNPVWVTACTAHTLDEIAEYLENNGPQQYRGISDAFPAMKRNRIVRMLSILENWGIVSCDRKRHLWGISSQGWRRMVKDRVMPEISLTGAERKRAVQRIQRRILRTIRECGDISYQDLADAVGFRTIDYFAEANIRRGRVVRHPCGSTVRYFMPSAGPIDDITAALAAQTSVGASAMMQTHA